MRVSVRVGGRVSVSVSVRVRVRCWVCLVRCWVGSVRCWVGLSSRSMIFTYCRSFGLFVRDM